MYDSDYSSCTRLDKIKQRYEALEDLNTEVRRFLAQAMFLVGADKIKEVLKRLDNTEDMK